jgi:hypothetical protein
MLETVSPRRRKTKRNSFCWFHFMANDPSCLSFWLQVAVKCILIALRDCHEMGWTINDLRWPNIIDVAGEWYVIDCEFARPIGANLPSMTIRPPGQFCSPTSDLFMLHQLLHDVRRLFQDDLDFRKLFTSIEDEKGRSSTSAAKLLMLRCMEEISSPPLSPSHP